MKARIAISDQSILQCDICCTCSPRRLGYGDLHITLYVAAFAFQSLGNFVDGGIDLCHAVQLPVRDICNVAAVVALRNDNFPVSNFLHSDGLRLCLFQSLDL